MALWTPVYVLAIFALVCGLACGDDCPKGYDYYYHAPKLSGANEVPPVASTGTGAAKFYHYSDKKYADRLCYEVEIGTPPLNNINQAHIHMAPAGSNGNVTYWLYPAGGTAPLLKAGPTTGDLVYGWVEPKNFVGPWKGLTWAAVEPYFAKGQLYANVHTVEYPAGALRDQIVKYGA